MYALILEIEYEGEMLLGVYSTLGYAKDAAREYVKRHRNFSDILGVVEVNVVGKD